MHSSCRVDVVVVVVVVVIVWMRGIMRWIIMDGAVNVTARPAIPAAL